VEYLAFATRSGGTGQQEQIVAQLLCALLDSEQERHEEVCLRAWKSGLVGEDAEDAVAPFGHATGDRIGDIAGVVDGLVDTLARLLGNAARGSFGIVEHERHRRLADPGKPCDVALRQPPIARQGCSSLAANTH
jgi:hypothetical protein